MEYFACCFIPQSKMPLLLISLFLCQLRIAHACKKHAILVWISNFFIGIFWQQTCISSDTCNFEDFQISCLLVVPSRACAILPLSITMSGRCVSRFTPVHISPVPSWRATIGIKHISKKFFNQYPVCEILTYSQLVFGGISLFPVKKEPGCDAFQKTI